MMLIPGLGPPRPFRLPEQAERILPSGLTVIAVRRPAAPLVELRLGVPFAETDLAERTMLTQVLLSGTGTTPRLELATRLDGIGGVLSARADADRLQIDGSALGTGLDGLLDVLVEVLEDAAYPDAEVHTERERLSARLRIRWNQPAHLARMALWERIYGDHPYRWHTPTIAGVRAVQSASLRALHGRRLRPGGANLVIVADLDPDTVLDTALRRMSGWMGSGVDVALPPTPPLQPGALLLIDRPGAVESSLRLALPAVGRTHPDYPALQLANMIFGGYFSSRWTENLREDKGYTYGPHSRIDHSMAGSTVVAAAEVATEVTAAAFVETLGELGRIACLPPSVAEVDQARQYARGSMLIGMSSAAGLARLGGNLAGFGLRLDHLVDHAHRLGSVSCLEVLRAGTTYLAPARAVGVVLGDADRIGTQLAALTAVEVRPDR